MSGIKSSEMLKPCFPTDTNTYAGLENCSTNGKSSITNKKFHNNKKSMVKA